MNRGSLEEKLRELPLYSYFYVKPEELEFSHRVRWVCEQECPRYGRSWACPPGVGSVEACRERCLRYECCLVIATATEVNDIADKKETLSTRAAHEAVTDLVAGFLREEGAAPFVLSTESCEVCSRCAILDGLPCRFPERMHPCVESQGINVIPVLERNGLEFRLGQNLVTWISLLLF